MKLKTYLLRHLKSVLSPEGTQHWLQQRLTGLVSIVFGIWFLFVLPGLSAYNHAELLGWIGDPFHSAMLVIGALIITWHSWLGVQVVIEDYVHDMKIKFISLRVSWLLHELLGIFVLFTVLKIALGGAW